jgi:hypothetical protein
MRHTQILRAVALGFASASLFATTALADCTGFKWPLDTELAWFAAGGDVAAKNGDELAEVPAKAIALTLKPSKSVKLPVAAGVKEGAVGSDTFSGWVSFPAGVKPGLYQVTISADAWIDLVQNGALVHSKGFTGRRECDVLHKSVRYEIGPGPVSIQITGAPSEKVRLTVNAAK